MRVKSIFPTAGGFAFFFDVVDVYAKLRKVDSFDRKWECVNAYDVYMSLR